MSMMSLHVISSLTVAMATITRACASNLWLARPHSNLIQPNTGLIAELIVEPAFRYPHKPAPALVHTKQTHDGRYWRPSYSGHSGPFRSIVAMNLQG